MQREWKQLRSLSSTGLVALTLAGCAKSQHASAPAAPATQQASPRLEGRTPDDAYGRPASVSQPSGSWNDPSRQQLPADARLVAEGAPELKFAVPEDGWVYLVHPSEGQIYRGAVRHGENVTFDAAGVLHVGNKPVWKYVVARSDTFKIYFKRD
jgi:hypothetical protein